MKVTSEVNKKLKAIAKTLPVVYEKGNIAISGDTLQKNGVERDYIKSNGKIVVPNQQIKVDHHRRMKNLYKRGGFPAALKYRDMCLITKEAPQMAPKVAPRNAKVYKKSEIWWMKIFYTKKARGARWIFLFTVGFVFRSIKKSKFELTESQKKGKQKYIRLFGWVITMA